MKKYGLIGEKLGHSFSPYLHSRLGEYDYRLYELREEEIPGFLKSEDIAGVNVTIPYKQTVLKYCNELSDKVKKIGSANTLVKKDDGTLYADNTDYDGFEYILDKTDADVRGKKILVLGSGGASKAVCSVLRDKKAEVVIISRRGENNYGNLTKHRDAYAVVNTTPVGMYPNVDASPVDLTVFPCLRYVLDLIYNPYKTKLLIQAEEMGLVYINGSDMLVEQARVAAEIFSGHAIDPEVVRDISSDMTRNALDVTLIGMPGCGKTTIGRLLAEKLGRRFIDIDEEIVKRSGRSIPEIFAQDGEEGFRRIETQVTAEFAKESSLVISTGGGVVTRDENRPLLKMNSVIIFLKRDIERLSVEGRPLSIEKTPQVLYEQRLPRYTKWADIQIDVTDPEDTVGRIMDTLGYQQGEVV